MSKLFPFSSITTTRFPKGEVQAVSAKDLHACLKMKSKFMDWIRGHIKRHEFMEDYDFLCITEKGRDADGACRKEYMLSLDMAHDLLMIESNEDGKSSRKGAEVQNRARLALKRLNRWLKNHPAPPSVTVPEGATSNSVLPDEEPPGDESAPPAPCRMPEYVATPEHGQLVQSEGIDTNTRAACPSPIFDIPQSHAAALRFAAEAIDKTEASERRCEQHLSEINTLKGKLSCIERILSEDADAEQSTIQTRFDHASPPDEEGECAHTLPPSTDDGFILGHNADTGALYTIPDSEWLRHTLIVGTGRENTEMRESLLSEQIVRGGGVLWIDGSPTSAFDKLRCMCISAGRTHDVLIIDPERPEQSNTYNPLLYGAPDEVSSRCISLIPSTESSAGDDFYRQEAHQALVTLVNASRAAGRAYNFLDLSILLSNRNALSWLEQATPSGSLAQQQLSLYLNQFKSTNRNGVESIDTAKLKQQLGGIAGRMFSFGTGAFGEILNTYNPEVRLKEDLLANKIIYVRLPMAGKAEIASNFGKMVVGDFRSAIAQIQALTPFQRPKIPALAFFDNCGSYVNRGWKRMFEDATNARVAIIPSFISAESLEALGAELPGMVIGNTGTQMAFEAGECVVTDSKNNTHRVRFTAPRFSCAIEDAARTLGINRRHRNRGLDLLAKFNGK